MRSAPSDLEAVAAYQMAGQDVGWLLRHWAEHKPEHPFLIWEPKSGADRTWTYARFLAEARGLAVGLARRGVGKGDPVMIHCENCPEMVLAWYACALLGAVAVTTNTKSAGPEIEYFASHARCVAAITQPQFAELVAAHARQLKWIAVTEDDGGEPAAAQPHGGGGGPERIAFAALAADGAAFQERPAEPMLPVGIMYTSGTTSRPKAVVHTHANAVWASRIGPDNIALGSDDRYLIYTPFFHVNAQSWATWSALGVGATVVLVPKWSASRFWDWVTKHRVTHFSVMGFTMQAIVGKPIPPNSLKVGVFGLTMPPLEKMVGFRLTSNWGMTETVTHATRNQLAQHYPAGTMGRPTPGYEFLIVDPESGEVCAPGETGELWVRGRRGIQLFLEYFDNPEANAKAFTKDGWFKTGDLVALSDDGFFFYKDRDKDALKVGGENVSAKEVEDACRMVPGIVEVAVVGQKHAFLNQVAVAFVIPAPNAPPDLSDRILKACAERLAGFKCPKAVYLVDEFPRATLEKVAKNKLRELADAYADAGEAAPARPPRG